VGDLPNADMAPPENVLFVCKLNPVTSDDDLEIIFSRFGRVKRSDFMILFPLYTKSVIPYLNRKPSLIDFICSIVATVKV
jgi:RNA recognition motif-containing protein